MRRLLTLLLIGVMALAALPVAAQSTTGTVTANRLNVRNAPSAGGDTEVLDVLPRGTIVNVIGRSADTSFYNIVTPAGVTGWAASAYIAVPNYLEGRLAPVTSGETGATPVVSRAIVNTQALNVRTAPDLRAPIIVQLPGGTGVDIIGRNSNASWYEVVLNDGRLGWVSSEYLIDRTGNAQLAPRQNSDQIASLPAAVGVVRAIRLNVRTTPDPLAPIITIAVGGERVSLLAQNSDSSWYFVRLERGVEGWVYSEYISFYLGDSSQAQTVTVPNSALPSQTFANGLVNQPRLNVRPAPDPNSTPITSIGYQTRVTVVGRNSNTTWLQITVNGVTGWVYAPFVDPNVGNFDNAPVTG